MQRHKLAEIATTGHDLDNVSDFAEWCELVDQTLDTIQQLTPEQ